MRESTWLTTSEDQELAYLQAQIQKAEEEAAQLTLHLVDLKLDIRRFQAEYSARVGPLYAELDRIQLEIQEYQLRTELIRQGIDPASEEIEQTVQERFEAERERLQASQRQAQQDESSSQDESQSESHASDQIRKLYLRLAKRFHPDKAQTPEERLRNEQMMAIINEAYEAGDRVTLERLVSDEPDSPPEEEPLEIKRQRLRRQLERLSQSIDELKRDIEQHRRSEVYQLREQVERAREQGVDLLGRLSREIQYKIASAQRRLLVVKNLFERWASFLKGRMYGSR